MSERFNLSDYVTVQERINQFWKDHPDGAIRTDLVSDPADWQHCRYRAEVYRQHDRPRPDAVGYAFEIAGKGMANQTSHEENAETSAIGRALATMGYATSQKGRPSREEMQKVQRGSTVASAPDSRSQATPGADLSNGVSWYQVKKWLAQENISQADALMLLGTTNMAEYVRQHDLNTDELIARITDARDGVEKVPV